MRAGDDAQLMSHPAIFLILHQMPEATSFSSFDFMHPLQNRKSPTPFFCITHTHTHMYISTTDFSGSSLNFHSFFILSLFSSIGSIPALLKEVRVHVSPRASALIICSETDDKLGLLLVGQSSSRSHP